MSIIGNPYSEFRVENATVMINAMGENWYFPGMNGNNVLYGVKMGDMNGNDIDIKLYMISENRTV